MAEASNMGKRARSSSPPSGRESGQPEAKRTNRATSPVVQAEVTIEGAATVTNGGGEESDDDVGPSLGKIAAEEDEDDDVGPSVDAAVVGKIKKKKKKAVLPHESLYLSHLPSSSRYSKSFMHRDQLSSATLSPKTDFLITASTDGHLKFWKKTMEGLTFVKHYRASLSSIVGVAIDGEGKVAACISEGGEGRVFDVVNFDMINILKFDYTPKTCCWVHHPSDGRTLLAVSDTSSPNIRIYDGRGDGKPLYTLDKLHRDSVHIMAYSAKYDCVISADEAGFIEYWRPREPWAAPDDVPGLWKFKSSTDLFEFKKAKSVPSSLTLSPDSSHFVTLSLPDRQVRVFNFLTGKKTRQYDEGLAAISEMQQAGTAVIKLDEMEFARRMAVERDLEREGEGGEGGTGKGGLLRTANAVWDESGNFILYSTLLGIKVVNTVTNRVSALIGAGDSTRWLNLSLYQGAPQKEGLNTMAMVASANPLLAEKESRDPTLFATSYKKQRFYVFTRDEPEHSAERDVFNEKPNLQDQSVAMATTAAVKPVVAASYAIVHTTMGDIHVRLYPDVAPLAVENYAEHARSGYFNGLIFHRVIPKFMVQGGDPLGDGTGGESIWGKYFEDEYGPKLKFDRPWTLAMANAGPRTNGSQHFFTLAPCPWLDNKHTIFGRAVAGLDVLQAIGEARTDKTDKPLVDIKIVSIDIS